MMLQLVRISWCILSVMIVLGQAAFAAAPSPNDGYDPYIAFDCDALQILGDGSILAVSDSDELVRVNPDGSRDSNYHVEANDKICAIALQPDGKIILGGWFSSIGDFSSRYLARLNPDGTPDMTFHPVITPAEHGGGIKKVLIQPDGKILIEGYFSTVSGVNRPMLARLNPDGSLDTTFNPAVIDINNYSIMSMALQADGKLLVGSDLNTPLIRLRRNGSVDDTFQLSLNGSANQIHEIFVLPNGRILIGGTFNSPIEQETVLRLYSNGTRDASFKNGANWNALLGLQRDGKFLISGKWTLGGKDHYGIMRQNPDGSSDPSFRYETGAVFKIYAFGVQQDGKLLVGGENPVPNPINDAELFRLNVDGSLDSNFDLSFRCNYRIRAIVRQADGKILIGGDFRSINGIPRSKIARLNANNTLDVSFDPGGEFNNIVTGIGIQPDGGIIVIGEFTFVGGVARTGIARLNADGALDPAFNPKFNDKIKQIRMLPDGKMVLQGNFFYLNDTRCPPVVRLNANGSLDTSFSKYNLNIPTQSIDLQPDEKILIGGSIVGDPYSVADLHRYNQDGSLDRSFIPRFHSFSRSEVDHVKVTHDGGIFAVRRESPSNNLWFCHFNSNGSTDTAHRSEYYYANGSIYSVAEQADGKILLGGDFDFHSSISGPITNGFNYFGRLNEDGTPDAGFKGNKAVKYPVRAICPGADGTMLIGGDFTQYQDVKQNFLAELNEDGSLTTNSLIAAAPNGEVNALAIDHDAHFYIGGDFNSVHHMPRRGAARMSVGSDLDTSFSANLDHVSVMAVLPSGKLLVCDRPVEGSENHMLTRRNSDGTTDTTFSKIKTDARVNCMTVQSDGSAIIAGGFHHVKGFAMNQIARLNANGGVDHSFNAGDGVDLGEIILPDDGSDDAHDWIYHQSRGRISSMAVHPDGRIIIAGEFDRVAGIDRKNIARLAPNGVVDTSFDPGAGTDGQIFTVAIQSDGKVLIAGEFVTVDGKPRHGIARLHHDGSVDEAFIPETAEYSYFQTLALQSDGKILVGGFYSSGKGYGRMARLNPDGSFDTLFETPEPLSFNFAGVNAIALQSDGKLLVGGLFGKIGATSRRNFARVSNPTAALQSLVVAPGGAGITWRLGGSYPQPYQALFEESADGVNWTALGWGTAVPGVGFAITHQRLPILTNHYVRATGWSTGGLNNGSVSIHRSTLNFYSPSYNTTFDWACYE